MKTQSHPSPKIPDDLLKKISNLIKDTFMYQSLKRPALFYHDALIYIVLYIVSICVFQIYMLEQSNFDHFFFKEFS